MNYLYFGDCFDVLRNDIKDGSVDLVYIDPPFNSKRNYNIFFDDKDIHTQRIAFEDTWSFKNIQDSLAELQSMKTEKIHKLLNVYAETATSAFPYLVMMSLRIIELHRVLKTTGSFYLHCDPTMSHYLKTLCDVIFGKENFRNEIVWERNSGTGSSKNLAKKFPSNTDTVFFYSKSENYKFTHIMRPLSVSALKRYDKIDENGKRFFWADMRTYSQEKLKRLLEIKEAIFPPNAKNPRYKKYLDETKGTPVPNIWYDIEQIGSLAAERMGYPTQKPKALLERIIKASSDDGDTILDAFCGCGTTVDAAEGMKRNWIGIDISPIAISLIRKRLNESYGKSLSRYEVRGIPKDEASAIRLWQQNPFAFQDWWITEFCAFSTTFGKKGADKGIDGIAKYLVTDNETVKAAFQVKGGKVQSKDTDALLGAMDKHGCQMGVFLTIGEPTKPMFETVAASGFVEVPGFKYPRLQILTLAEFFSGKQLKLPQTNITFESAKLKGKGMQQSDLL